MDRLPEALVGKLRSCGEEPHRSHGMSAAMVVHHRADDLQAAGSERVNLRCTELLRQLAQLQGWNDLKLQWGL